MSENKKFFEKITQYYYGIKKLFKSKNKVNENAFSNVNDSQDDIINEFQNLKVADLMIPRGEITAIWQDASLDEVKEQFIKSWHTRILVYKDNLDNVVGYLNIKDLLPLIINNEQKNKFSLSEFVREIIVVVPAMKAFVLLEKMRRQRTHIALVVDELGGTDGLVTIENLIEAVIGDINDEHDKDLIIADFKKISDKIFEVTGRIKIETLEENLNIDFNSNHEDYDTLAGLLMSFCGGNVPAKGSKVLHPTGVEFEIIDSDMRKIRKVLVKLP